MISQYSHMKEETRAWFEPEGSVGGRCCWFDAQAAFRSSKSFLEILDVLFCCWFDPRRFLTSLNSSLMKFTAASSNVEDSHDPLSSTVDCASTSRDKNVTNTEIVKVTRKADQRALDMLTNCGPFDVYSAVCFTSCMFYITALLL